MASLPFSMTGTFFVPIDKHWPTVFYNIVKIHGIHKEIKQPCTLNSGSHPQEVHKLGHLINESSIRFNKCM